MQEFEICYGLSELPSNAVVTYRKAAKAVIEKDGKLLLLQNVLSGKCWKKQGIRWRK